MLSARSFREPLQRHQLAEAGPAGYSGPMTRAKRYWLMKSEPSVFSIDDLRRVKVTGWDGVRNYQARNFMRDMKLGDGVLLYHSNADPAGVAGIAEIVREAYPDPTQFDRKDDHYDPKATRALPRWDQVDVRFVEAFPTVLSLQQLREMKALKGMLLLTPGRLSVQPVTKPQWDAIHRAGDQ